MWFIIILSKIYNIPINLDNLPAELVEACFSKREVEYCIEDIKYYIEMIWDEMDFDYNSIKESDFENSAREFLDNHDATYSDSTQMRDICQMKITHGKIKIENQRFRLETGCFERWFILTNSFVNIGHP